MNEIEAFLANQKRYRCDRLNADLTQDQCHANRTRQAHLASGITKIIACENCPGLGKEIAPVTTRTNRCSVEGCDKYRVIGTMCTAHAKELGSEKALLTDEQKRKNVMDKISKMQAAKKAKKEQIDAQKTAEIKDKPITTQPVDIKPLPVLTQADVDLGFVKEEVVRNAINHPPHYGGADNPYEAIKVIEAWDLGFHLGNVIKYVSRAGKKGNELEDLKKAAWYLQREIEKRSEA